MSRTKKPELKYILQVNDDIYEFINKNVMDIFISELQIKEYSINIIKIIH